MADLDLDARREALGKPPILTFRGETFEMSVEMPYALVEAWEANVSEPEFCELLMGDNWERLKALRPSLEEIKEINRHNFWGVTEGEAQASAGSSADDGTDSRPTSSGSTESTSAKQSGGRKRSASAA
jgi:hypothetical protein